MLIDNRRTRHEQEAVNNKAGNGRKYGQLMYLAKLFMWKVKHDILPVLGKLNQRIIQVEPLCFSCKPARERFQHALRDCPFAQVFGIN